jgi:hypothetical protein
MTPEERFDDLVGELTGIAGVTPPGPGRGFGSCALRCHDKIFAMLVRGQLVVKLSRGRVDALVDAGEGDRFDGNRGVPMRQWLCLDPGSVVSWPALAREALDYARSGSRDR